VSVAALAFHVQVGVSGRNRLTGEWADETIEIGGGGRLTNATIASLDYRLRLELPPFALEQKYDSNGRIGVDAVVTQSIGSYPHWMGPEEAVAIDGVGWDRVTPFSNIPYRGYEHVVVTMRGNPYSVVVNDTGAARTINGVQIPNGESAKLTFPLFLKMSQIENVKFYDLASGDEITPVPVMGSAYYYGAYCLNWTGDIRVWCNHSPPTGTNAEDLVYGDMKDENMDEILHGRDGSPIYGPAYILTNISFMTWWDFNQSDWGLAPQAKVNDEVVCSAHSTGHLIDYVVHSDKLKVDRKTNKATFIFTMSLTPQSGSSFPSSGCTFKCWDLAMGGSPESYETCPANHKASVYGYANTVATFKVTLSLFSDEWKIEPVE